MATETHRSEVAAGHDAVVEPTVSPKRKARFSLFGAMGLVLALALAAVALVQARQYQLLQQSTAYQDDYVVLSLYQMKVEPYFTVVDDKHHILAQQR